MQAQREKTQPRIYEELYSNQSAHEMEGEQIMAADFCFNLPSGCYKHLI